MSKKKKQAKSEAERPVSKAVPAASPATIQMQKWFPVLLCAIMGIIYWVFSENSEGFYQHDEVTHYFQMLHFWDNPMLFILDMWSRGGYKILYILPGMLGRNGIFLTNVLFTAGSCYLAYRISKKYDFKYPELAIILTGLQPLVVNLSFRCYPEIPSMFFTALLVLTLVNKRYIATALVASFLFSIRQEMAAIAIVMGLIFILKRKWIPLLLLAWAPLALNLLGWLHYGDSQYVVTMMVKGGLQDTYQRNGFFYFWMMLPDITGIVIFYLFISAATGWLFSSGKGRLIGKHFEVLLVFCLYFLMHCAFTSKSFGFGRSGGVARFMVVVSPLIGVIAAGGFNFFLSRESVRSKIIAALLSFGIIFTFLSYYDEISPLVFDGFRALSFRSQNNQSLFIISIAMGLLALIPMARKVITAAAFIIPALYAMLCIKGVDLNYEDNLLQETATWLDIYQPKATRVYSHHVVFDYFYEPLQPSKNVLKAYDSTRVINAKPGEIFIFENHYAIKEVRPQLFDPAQFNVLKEFSVQGGNFRSYVIQKR